jgi:hypothetical protein
MVQRENRKSRLIATLVLAAVALFVLLRYSAQEEDFDEIEYRGEKIRLSKKYSDFSDYKNDPDNILPAETARVQKLVAEAPIAHSFSSREDLIRAAMDITFPGYGLSTGGGVKADGSQLVSLVIEIPRANQDRYIVFRQNERRYEYLDDFVTSETSYPFQIQEQDGAYVYRAKDGKELFRRPVR